jgi:hypothetical protein
MRRALEGHQAVVDVPAEGAQTRQVDQVAPDPEVVGVVESGFGAQRLVELEVLLDAGVLVIKSQAGLDSRWQRVRKRPGVRRLIRRWKRLGRGLGGPRPGCRG